MTDINIQGARADTWEWTVEVGGNDLGTFDEKDGGDIDSDETVFRPGGMKELYSLGGPRTVTNLTLRRNYRLHRDHPLSEYLIKSVGKYNAKLTGQPLDHAGSPFGDPFIYVAKVKRVQFPTHNSNAADASMLEIEFTANGMPVADNTQFPKAV